MMIPLELYPSQDDLLYEEEILRNPFSLKLWWRYLVTRNESPFKKRSLIYERALKALPGMRKLPVTHSRYESLNNTFERALVTMHKMPKIWVMYLQTLTEQKLVTRARRTFGRALCALPLTQHDRIWGPYVDFLSQGGILVETPLRVYRRYLKLDPTHIENFIEFLVSSELWQEAAKRFAEVLNDYKFCSVKVKTKHHLWLQLCDFLTHHATEVLGLDVDAIIRDGIRKCTDEVGRLWTSLADYYIRRGLFEKETDVFEEGITSVVTVRDFSVIFDGYTRFEESVIAAHMESSDIGDGEDNKQDKEEEDERFNAEISLSKFMKKTLHGFWCNDDNDVESRMARLKQLIDRRPELANSVLLRQNPHNVKEWRRRVKLFEGNLSKQILTFTEAVRTVDPMKAVGNLHTLWISFAKLYVEHNDIANARVIFDKAVQVNYKTVDNLASVWYEWVDVEVMQRNFEGAKELIRSATAEPSEEVKRRVKLHKSVRLWTMYADLEQVFGTLESTRAVYERILDMKIERKYFEDVFKVYERGVKIFKYPHVKDIWATYLSKVVKRYKNKKLERARELLENAPLYLQNAKLEEDSGFARRSMKIYDQAVKAVPDEEKLQMYEIYVARAAKFFSVLKTREIYQQAIVNKDVTTMCMKYADLEKSLGETDRARVIYIFSSQFADPRSENDFWSRWHEFERSVSASYSQTHFILQENLMQKETVDSDTMKHAGAPEDEIAQRVIWHEEKGEYRYAREGERQQAWRP
ncbi:hypothetical protein MKX01_040019 [Papaver californicum]|nr:hypothetical protein MKX01_040019 [Papaver californicum]